MRWLNYPVEFLLVAALLWIGCCIAPARAQHGVVPVATRSPLLVTWAPATGPVASYRAKLVYMDGLESSVVVGLPPQEFTPRRGIPFEVKVQACAADGRCGPWSVFSETMISCPQRADIDCNLAVGISDFNILVQDWGKVYGERVGP